MSNVFSNASFAVLSVMTAHDADDTYLGSTVFVQRKPESSYGNLTIISFNAGGSHGLRIEDFDQQAAFDANVAPAIQSDINAMNSVGPVLANSNISVNSYTMDGKLNA